MLRTTTGMAIGFLAVITLSMAGCAQHETHMESAAAADPTAAVAMLYPTEGNFVYGTVTFTRTESGTRVVAKVEGLTPGKHGFHIHEFGDCSTPDGTGAGGHFNPAGKAHAGPMAPERHVGDLGNLEAGEDGQASLDWMDAGLTFGGPESIIGRAVIVHAGEDDLTTQPTGNAGGRVACGIIGVKKPL